MDEEKFDSLLMDELYGELDEETSAAMKRFAASNPRAGARLAELQASRRALTGALTVPVPEGLEDRILRAARDAQKVVPMRTKAGGWVSRAGSWAMRPQTAMAAVFLLMIGSSVLLLRGKSARSPASSSMTVTENGVPAAAPAADEQTALDPKAVALAHGTGQPVEATKEAKDEAHGEAPALGAMAQPPPAALANAAVPTSGPTAVQVVPPKPSAPHDNAVALDDALADKSDRDSYGGLARSAAGKGGGAGAPADGEGRGWPSGPGQAGGSGYATPPPAAPAAEPLAAADTKGRGPERKKSAEVSPSSPAPATGDFEGGMQAYRAKDYGEATHAFDRAAAGGDPSAALWAARSVREAAGCSAAVARFDALASRAFGTSAGYDATFEGGRCYRDLGATDAARARFTRLLTVPSHLARAQAEIDAMAPRASAPAAKPATKKAAPAKH